MMEEREEEADDAVSSRFSLSFIPLSSHGETLESLRDAQNLRYAVARARAVSRSGMQGVAESPQSSKNMTQRKGSQPLFHSRRCQGLMDTFQSSLMKSLIVGVVRLYFTRDVERASY